MTYVIALIFGVVGFGLGYLIRQLLASRSVESAQNKAEQILAHAKQQQKELLIEAKEQAVEMLEKAKQEENQRLERVEQQRIRLEERESTFTDRLLQIEDRQKNLDAEQAKAVALQEEVAAIKKQQMEKLERIAQLTQDEAQKVLLDNTEKRVANDLVERTRKLEHEAGDTLERKAHQLLSLVTERLAMPHTVEGTTSIVDLPNEDLKGRIIGREGRNIKTLEQLTGVEIIVDETPESIVISGFNPIRRQVAKRALEQLIVDGRIHPGRIEEAVAQAKAGLSAEIKKAGEDAASEVGVAGLDPKLLQILGRLKYRTSYGQNQLQHAVEVALLGGMLAEELGANVAVCKKGGLLHDIGKAVDHEVAGGHPEIGYDILKKFGLPEEVAYVCIGHHEDRPTSLEAVIVKAADAISGSRPGARKDSYENYLQRLDELEGVARSFPGVEKVYAIQAGREVRVFVKPGEVDDWAAGKLARSIADQVEAELKYPGEIRITVIREKRVIEYAR
jgi:ribonuclease Y